MTIRTTKAETGGWQSAARAWAREAWEHDTARQQGIYRVAAAKGQRSYCVVYSNYPDAGHPRLRGQQLAEIRRRLKAQGIAVLAYATHRHTRGGYSDALLIGIGQARCVERLVNGALDVCWSQRKD